MNKYVILIDNKYFNGSSSTCLHVSSNIKNVITFDNVGKANDYINYLNNNFKLLLINKTLKPIAVF